MKKRSRRNYLGANAKKAPARTSQRCQTCIHSTGPTGAKVTVGSWGNSGKKLQYGCEKVESGLCIENSTGCKKNHPRLSKDGTMFGKNVLCSKCPFFEKEQEEIENKDDEDLENKQ